METENERRIAYELGEIAAYAKAISQTVYYLQTTVTRIEELQRHMLAGAEAQKETESH